MAANSRSSSKTQSKGAKKPAPKKKAASSTAKKPAKPSPKRPAQKSAAKPVSHTTTQKAPQKTLPAEKKAAEVGLAFDKKIDQLAKKSLSTQTSSKTVLKTIIGILIIIAAAAIVYLFYPRGKSDVVKEEIANKPETPGQDIKLPEPPKDPAKPEPKKEAVKTKAVDENIYVVKYKDQLTEISKKQYGSFIQWKRIYEANKDKIKNPNLIFPGQELVIPKIEK